MTHISRCTKATHLTEDLLPGSDEALLLTAGKGADGLPERQAIILRSAADDGRYHVRMLSLPLTAAKVSAHWEGTKHPVPATRLPATVAEMLNHLDWTAEMVNRDHEIVALVCDQAAGDISIEGASYDYSGMPAEVAHDARTAVVAFQKLQRRSLEAAADIGHLLIRVRSCLAHGQFMAWLDAEFGSSRTAAYRFIDLAERLDPTIFPKLGNLGVSVAYKVAAKSTPESARAKIVSALKAAEAVSSERINEIIKAERSSTARGPAVQLFADPPSTKRAEPIRTHRCRCEAIATKPHEADNGHLKEKLRTLKAQKRAADNHVARLIDEIRSKDCELVRLRDRISDLEGAAALRQPIIGGDHD